MSLFAVTREAGPSWTDGKGAFEQPAVNDHAAFMSSLADEGFVLFAGPLAGSEHDRIRVLLIAEPPAKPTSTAVSPTTPGHATQRLVTTSVEPWNLFVGAERLGAQPAAQERVRTALR